MWVCRQGIKAFYLEKAMNDGGIYLAWPEYTESFESYTTIEKCAELVKKHSLQNAHNTSIRNRAGQIYSFRNIMHDGDLVLIPRYRSLSYILARIIGPYEYIEGGPLYHFRKVEVIVNSIPRDWFPRDIQYSLGAFRTLFIAKRSSEIVEIINNNCKCKVL